MMAFIEQLKGFRATDFYNIFYSIGSYLGASSGVVYFILAMVAIYVSLRVVKFTVKAGMILVVLYCFSGILAEYLPYLENVLRIF